jgi:hypothetical protein
MQGLPVALLSRSLSAVDVPSLIAPIALLLARNRKKITENQKSLLYLQ